MSARETWYVLEDGTAVPPGEVSPDDKGVLIHKSGRVAMRSADTPMTRQVDVDDEKAKKDAAAKAAADKKAAEDKAAADANATEKQAAGDKAAAESAAKSKKTADMEPQPAPKAAEKPGYKTR